MKRLSVGLVLMLLCTLSIFAQNKVISVSGRVVESDSKEPAAQATVQLLSLPDSAYAAGIASSNKGWFTLPKVKAGKYLLKISYIGFRTKFVPVQLSNNVPEKKMGNIALEPDAVMLSEAVITGTAPEVTVKEDTLEYNSTAYRTPEGAMLEELVKKLPGAEIDDDGNVKINGKEVKKIMVDGKEFFGGDVKTGLKNLPVNMIDKLKTYDKKSDLARVTGIDDGEEETVLDLKVKKGMNQGWFGNANVAIGVLAPFAEEVVFRGAILRTLLGLMSKKNHWVAIMISAAIFGLAHANVAQFVNALLLGLLLGWMYYRTKSLVPGILLHWVNNTMAYVLANIMPQSDGKLIDLFHGDEKTMYYAVGFSLCIMIPSFIQLVIRLKKVKA